MASRLDLVVDQGTTFRRVLLWKDSVTNLAINLTGFQAYMQIRDSPGGAVLATLSAGAGLTIVPLLGEVDLTITPAMSNAWTWRLAYYDLVLWSATEDDRLIQGTVTLDPRITVHP